MTDIVGGYGRTRVYVLETVDVIPWTVGLVSTHQISECWKCVHGNLHTHYLMLRRVSKGLEKSFPVGMLLSASSLGIPPLSPPVPSQIDSLLTQLVRLNRNHKSPQYQHALQVGLRLLFIHMGEMLLSIHCLIDFMFTFPFFQHWPLLGPLLSRSYLWSTTGS